MAHLTTFARNATETSTHLFYGEAVAFFSSNVVRSKDTFALRANPMCVPDEASMLLLIYTAECYRICTTARAIDGAASLGSLGFTESFRLLDRADGIYGSHL